MSRGRGPLMLQVLKTRTTYQKTWLVRSLSACLVRLQTKQFSAQPKASSRRCNRMRSTPFPKDVQHPFPKSWGPYCQRTSSSRSCMVAQLGRSGPRFRLGRFRFRGGWGCSTESGDCPSRVGQIVKHDFEDQMSESAVAASTTCSSWRCRMAGRQRCTACRNCCQCLRCREK